MTVAEHEELIYRSERTQVVRTVRADGTRVVRKRPLGMNADDRLRNESAVLQHLVDVPGTPRLAPPGGPADTIDLVDSGMRPLSEAPAPWAPGPLLEVALRLAETVAGIHRRGVIHRDINPANILVAVTGDRAVPATPQLIDFELAVQSVQDHEVQHTQDALAGTLPYLAPEQTGRTGRPVDHRADLYSLGATLYQLATGEPPFGRDGDPLSLIHGHLARVPVPASHVNPLVPDMLAAIIGRLLQKDPDDRYQSGEGLAHDLARVEREATFTLGTRDFPMRLAPPAVLIGRDTPQAVLHDLLAAAASGRTAACLVTGPAGVGKTALVDQLRTAAAAGGRVIAGRFDQHRYDLAADAIGQAFVMLGGQLLAEPDDVVADLRTRLHSELGRDLSLFCAVAPAFRTLLGIEPEPDSDTDPSSVWPRIRSGSLRVLQTVTGCLGPLTIIIDDIQWASPPALQFLADLLDSEGIPGMLLIGALRDDEVDESHPLLTRMAGLRGRDTFREIRLENLDGQHVSVLVAELLRLPVAQAASLSEVLAERTGGNPLDLIELINALRRDGVLLPAAEGWEWDEAAVRRFVSRSDVVDLLAGRIESLPAGCRGMVDLLTCLGAEVSVDLLAAAAGRDAGECLAALLPAVDDGLITIDAPLIRFRHDRVYRAALNSREPAARARTSLSAARRLALDPDHSMTAAAQYLAAIDILTVPGVAEPGEKAAAATLLRRAASASRLLADQAAVEVHLAAALSLMDENDEAYPQARAERHAALCALGRYAEADQVFADLVLAYPDPTWLAGPIAEQIGGLINRRDLAEALRLGLGHLTKLGVEVPDRSVMASQAEAGFAALDDWLAGARGDRQRELSDPRLIAVARVINALIGAAFFADLSVREWLLAQTAQLWAAHGTCAPMVGTLSHLGTVRSRTDSERRAAYLALGAVVRTGDAYGYEPQVSEARMLYAMVVASWFEPVRTTIGLICRAREALLRGGDLRSALYTYYGTVRQLLGSAALGIVAQEAKVARELAVKIGALADAPCFGVFERLTEVMSAPDGPAGWFTADEAADLSSLAGNDLGVFFYSEARALTAAIFGDDEALRRHNDAASSKLSIVRDAYGNVSVHALMALAAASRADSPDPAERDAAFSDLDRSHDFMAARAADQPGNFRSLYRFVEATRAAAHGDVAGALAAYDAALTDAGASEDSWHQPLMAERAALFLIRHGSGHLGEALLAEAMRGYARWGASAKVREMQRRHPSLGTARLDAVEPRFTTQSSTYTSSTTTDVIDMMAVLEAARAFSSESELDGLRRRVEQVLQSLTGATSVHMVLWSTESRCWTLPAEGDRPEMTVTEAGQRALLPLSAIRFAERTREPLVVDDVTLDSRVSQDACLAGLKNCSLLVVPVFRQRQPQAMLLLENRLSRKAFSTVRLRVVQLLVGQLTVAIDNARVHDSLERLVALRTEELAEANLRLEQLTVTDPLTGLPNRRGLSSFLETEFLRSVRSGMPISVAMVDIDHFKLYNDHYGHQGGDNCLQAVAGALSSGVRATDLVARYGGEEFCIVMPGATTDTAFAVAVRACRAVAGLRQPHVLTDAGIVTVSIGVSTSRQDSGANPDMLTKIADEALYEAKRRGRNRVVAGEP